MQGEGLSLPTELPNWLQDVGDSSQPTSGPLAKGNVGQKVLKMQAVQIRCMLGRGGETINAIRNRTGADIKVKHPHKDPWGEVSIVGNISKTEAVIREVLAAKGCPMPDPNEEPEFMPGQPPPQASVGQVEDIEVPAEMVGLFIGVGGANVKEMKAKATAGGGAVSIKVMDATTPGAPQKVQIAGDNAHLARQLVREKIEEVKQFYAQQVAQKGRARPKGKGKCKGRDFQGALFNPTDMMLMMSGIVASCMSELSYGSEDWGYGDAFGGSSGSRADTGDWSAMAASRRSCLAAPMHARAAQGGGCCCKGAMPGENSHGNGKGAMMNCKGGAAAIGTAASASSCGVPHRGRASQASCGWAGEWGGEWGCQWGGQWDSSWEGPWGGPWTGSW